MSVPLRRIFLASLLRRRLASALSLLAIALGVALGLAVHLIHGAALDEFGRGMRAVAGEADLQVVGPRDGFDEGLFVTLARRVIAFQIFYLLTCRSLHGSLLRIGVFSNPWIFSGIAALLLLQAAYIYAPPLQALFGSAPLDGGDLLLAAVVGAAILPVVAGEKALRRATGKPTLP